ncbi:hypothetical protein [Rubritalea tangerina]|uniref:Uncharacterized protein n=1 Tax=Rubritalea tangerina TaxID=430798 RepID=A0ABW4Z7I7_9BACT
MMFTELLAETEFPAQAILFAIVIIFSFLKWLFEKIFGKKEADEDPSHLEDLYEQYREEIRQRQTATPQTTTQTEQAPQLSPAQPSPPPIPAATSSSPRYSLEDIERARKKRLESSTSPTPQTTTKRKKRHYLHKHLKQKNSLRQALIVKQILDKPKAYEY